jgi:hypothetical protein
MSELIKSARNASSATPMVKNNGSYTSGGNPLAAGGQANMI